MPIKATAQNYKMMTMDDFVWKCYQMTQVIGVHPYILMMDVGMILSVLYYINVPKIALILTLVHILYETVFKYVQRVIIGKTWRSFILDFLLHYVPWTMFLSYVMGVFMFDSFDALGHTLPIMVACARLGCLVSGCCHGVGSPYGILYHQEIFQDGHFGCQKFSKNSNPGMRVLPIQLVESLVNMVIFFIVRNSTGHALINYAWYYSISRIILDIFRTSSARPRRCGGYISEAQALSSLILGVCSILYLLQ